MAAILLIPAMANQNAYAGGEELEPAVAMHFYEFNDNFEDTLGGPDITSSTGGVPEGTLTASYEFGENQGLGLFSPSVSSDNYSIEMCLKVGDGQDNRFEGWRKIIDFKDFDSNNGLYVSGNVGRTDQLEFANLGFFGPTKITNEEFFHVVLTRDGTSDNVAVYLDGIKEFDFNDNSGRAVFNEPGNVMQFIQGDNAGEQPDGTVDYIKIYEGALSAGEVESLNQCPAEEPEPEPSDRDEDGIPDRQDNCPDDENTNQLDSDGDGAGDVCDALPFDFDNDGTNDEIDNCPFTPNPDQIDTDEDGTGDACERKSSGGDEAWKTRPTSGINYENGKQFVFDGFGWNGNFLTVEFDHYQPFDKEELKIGERSTLTAKVYAPNGLMSQSFGLGIQDIGSNDAEVELRANLNIDGSIDSIEVIQKTDVVDPETLTVSNEKAYCKDGDAKKLCDEIKFAFTLQEPLQYEKAYSQHIDFKRRAGQVWVNHGFEITGEQITPMLSNMIPSNVRDQGLLKVTQVEKYSPYWVADNHRMFEMNSFGSFKEINQSFERFQDIGTAHTRMHSGFGGIIAHEQYRALDMFDATSLVSELPASFAYIFPETSQRITEEMRQAMLVQEEIAQRIVDEMDRQDRHY
jgi:hypothetical protein